MPARPRPDADDKVLRPRKLFVVAGVAVVTWFASVWAFRDRGGRPDEYPYPDKAPRLFAVSGRVLFRGGAAARAAVSFRPLGDADPARWPSGYPRAVARADGSFVMSTFRPRDGVPAGRYEAVVAWNTTARPARGAKGRVKPAGPPKWVVEVIDGATPDLVFDLAE